MPGLDLVDPHRSRPGLLLDPDLLDVIEESRSLEAGAALVVRQGGRRMGLGLALGLLLSLGLTRLLGGVLFGIRPHDPATFALMTTLLAGVGLLASALPPDARRHRPLVALRSD